MVAVAAPTHPLAEHGEISIAQLAGQEFVAFESHLQIRREIDRFLGEAGVSVDVKLQFDNVETLNARSKSTWRDVAAETDRRA